MENTFINAHFEGANYTTVIESDDHEIISDEPLEDGGQNKGFDPFEILLAALATCTTATIKMYADRKGWVIDNIEMHLEMQQENDYPHIQKSIKIKGDLSEEQIKRLMIIADKCPVHKMLTHPNKISTTIIAINKTT